MKDYPNTMKVDDIEYIRADKVKTKAKDYDGMPYVIVRTYSAGVHFGFLKKREGKEVTLINSRRVWYWNGAASLSQLAMEGTSLPNDCKFPCIVKEIILTEAIEIIPLTEKAKNNLYGVPIWKK